MKSQLKKLSLPQSLEEFSTIDTGNITLSQWSGAVNFVFVDDSLLLIKRSETMQSHKGQVAFLGGHKLINETCPITTAKREFEEETGLSSELLSTYGISHPVVTLRSKFIFPVVSYLDMDKRVLLDQIVSNGEWVEAILYPVNELLRPQNWVRGESSAYSIYFHPILHNRYLSKSQDVDKPYMLWGATARMIWKFFKNYPLNVKS
jgi:8-oxo-dGTP pyrophosphatase MutT (NUDIX family)